MPKAKDDCYRLIQLISVKQDIICIYPGCGQMSEVGHHLFRRDKMGTAFHSEAVRGVCFRHHGHAHARPAEFKKIMLSLIAERYYELQRLSKSVVRRVDYVAKREDLKGILKEMGERAA